MSWAKNTTLFFRDISRLIEADMILGWIALEWVDFDEHLWSNLHLHTFEPIVHIPVCQLTAKEARDHSRVSAVEVKTLQKLQVLRVLPKAPIVPLLVRLHRDQIYQIVSEAVVLLERWAQWLIWVQGEYVFEGNNFNCVVQGITWLALQINRCLLGLFQLLFRLLLHPLFQTIYFL